VYYRRYGTGIQYGDSLSRHTCNAIGSAVPMKDRSAEVPVEERAEEVGMTVGMGIPGYPPCSGRGLLDSSAMNL
jgi:hypothetical protein